MVRLTRAQRLTTGRWRAIAKRLDAVGVPFCRERVHLALLAEPDEAADRADCGADLFEYGREHLVHVPARAELERDVRDEPSAVEGIGECDCRARPLERETRLAHERLHPGELLLVEDSGRPDGAEDDADHLVAAGTDQDEDAALRFRDRVQPLIDDRRMLGVVHRECRAFQGRRALIPDASRLSAIRWPRRRGVIASVLARGDQRRRAVSLFFDQCHVCKLEVEDRRELVEQPRRRRRQALERRAPAATGRRPRRRGRPDRGRPNGRRSRREHASDGRHPRPERAPRRGSAAPRRRAPPESLRSPGSLMIEAPLPL